MRRRDRLYTWLRTHPLQVDAAIAVMLMLALTVVAGSGFGSIGTQALLGLVLCGALTFRRAAPVATLGFLTGCALLQWALDIALSAYDVTLMIGLYSVAAYGPRWASRAGLGTGIVGALLAAVRYWPNEAEDIFMAFAGMSAVVVAAWAMGDVRRIRHAYVTELMARAQQAERERDQRAQIAVAEERARIAREMHDVVAHNLSVIVVQADGGRYAGAENPTAALRVLDTIADTGRSALREMRRLLGVLRSTDDITELAPKPGLARVPDLVASVRNAGLPVTLEVTGPSEAVPDGAALAVFRIVQEALTNTLKHAGPAAHATVRLAYGPGTAHVVVEDDGRGAAATSDGAGLGLMGMRERVSAYGGSVTAGPRPGGGWRVEVDVPYGERVRPA